MSPISLPQFVKSLDVEFVDGAVVVFREPDIRSVLRIEGDYSTRENLIELLAQVGREIEVLWRKETEI